jgi:hypothetical protein
MLLIEVQGHLLRHYLLCEPNSGALRGAVEWHLPPFKIACAMADWAAVILEAEAQSRDPNFTGREDVLPCDHCPGWMVRGSGCKWICTNCTNYRSCND